MKALSTRLCLNYAQTLLLGLEMNTGMATIIDYNTASIVHILSTQLGQLTKTIPPVQTRNNITAKLQ